MRILLDTHAFLWYIWDDDRLSDSAVHAIEDPNNVVHLSIVSLWEITIKSSLGKLSVEQPLPEFFSRHVHGNGFLLLPILESHLTTLHTLPLHHRDPFDRLLVAQCITEEMTLVSQDQEVGKYAVPRCW